MTPATIRDIAIDRAEQQFREALDTSAAICARARDAVEEARRQADRVAVNERRLALARAHDQFSLAAERRVITVSEIYDDMIRVRGVVVFRGDVSKLSKEEVDSYCAVPSIEDFERILREGV